MDREVIEQDFRRPEFRGAKPEDYEFRDDGAIVRKDRWEQGMRRAASILGFSVRQGFEIEDVLRRLEYVADLANATSPEAT